MLFIKPYGIMLTYCCSKDQKEMVMARMVVSTRSMTVISHVVRLVHKKVQIHKELQYRMLQKLVSTHHFTLDFRDSRVDWQGPSVN